MFIFLLRASKVLFLLQECRHPEHVLRRRLEVERADQEDSAGAGIDPRESNVMLSRDQDIPICGTGGRDQSAAAGCATAGGDVQDGAGAPPPDMLLLLAKAERHLPPTLPSSNLPLTALSRDDSMPRASIAMEEV